MLDIGEGQNPLLPDPFDIIMSLTIPVLAVILLVSASIQLFRDEHISSSNKIIVFILILIFPIVGPTLWWILRWLNARKS